MGWRERMGAVEHLKTPTQNPQYPQKLSGGGGFEGIESIEHRNENENGYPIPTTEDEFAMDERQAIIQFDGGQDTQPVEYPVEVKMESAILGAADLRAVHRIKKSFDGAVVPSAEVTKFKPVIRR